MPGRIKAESKRSGRLVAARKRTCKRVREERGRRVWVESNTFFIPETPSNSVKSWDNTRSWTEFPSPPVPLSIARASISSCDQRFQRLRKSYKKHDRRSRLASFPEDFLHIRTALSQVCEPELLFLSRRRISKGARMLWLEWKEDHSLLRELWHIMSGIEMRGIKSEKTALCNNREDHKVILLAVRQFQILQTYPYALAACTFRHESAWKESD